MSDLAGVRQLLESAVSDRAAGAVEREQAARSARPGFLGDALRRKVVVEEVDQHDP